MAGPITTGLIAVCAPPVFLVALFAPTLKAAQRALEFFSAQINNDHTHKAYRNATRRFPEWCAVRGIGGFACVHVAAIIGELQGRIFPSGSQSYARL